MAIAVTFTPLQGGPGSTPGTVSAALTGLASGGTYNFTVVGPAGTWGLYNSTIVGTTATVVFPVQEGGAYTMYTQVVAAAPAAVPSGVFTSADRN